MRVNVYAEEMTRRVAIISKEIDGQQFTGLRFYLELPVTMANGAQISGAFMHRPDDDDSAAVTFWGKRDLRVLLRQALMLLDEHYQAAEPGRERPEDRLLWVDEIARVAHEANRAYCAALGDLSQPAWEDATAWQRDSAINGVLFHLEHPAAGDEASHNNWMEQKLADGWTWAKEKDPSLKHHPCLVPFDQLPLSQQLKDRLFRSIVHALTPAPSAEQS